MNVGLPGTGIGGLFYLTIALLMPLNALWKTVRGSGGAETWKAAITHSTIAVAILSALWGEAWGIQRFVHWASERGVFGGMFARIANHAHLLPGQTQLVALASCLTLVAVLLLVHGTGTILVLRAARISETR